MKKFSILIFHKCFTHNLNHACIALCLGLEKISVNLTEKVLVISCQDIIRFSTETRVIAYCDTLNLSISLLNVVLENCAYAFIL